MAFESILIVLHNVSYWKRCSPSSFIDFGCFFSFSSLSSLSATVPHTSTTWPRVRWTALCTSRTPAAGRCSESNHWASWKMSPRTWSWWPGPETSVSPTMTLAVETEAKLWRPLSPTHEVPCGRYHNQCGWLAVSFIHKETWLLDGDRCLSSLMH